MVAVRMNVQAEYEEEYESRISSSTLQGGDPQWPLGLRLGSVAAFLLGLWVRISAGVCMFVCCVLSVEVSTSG